MSFSARCRANVSQASPRVRAAPRAAAPARGRALVARAFAPPTVAQTKQNFLDKYNKPVPALYNTVIQELLVQQHFMRHNIRYKYDEIFALGITSVFDQILDDIDATERDAIFDAYIAALDETASTYRTDAEKVSKLAEEAGGPDALTPDESGTELQKMLAKVKAGTDSKEFLYTRFFGIGLFRLLEITKARDPKALEGLVSRLGVRQDSVNKDLLLYKGILSKMTAAKELMRDVLERERRKQAERDAVKTGDAPKASSEDKKSDSTETVSAEASSS